MPELPEVETTRRGIAPYVVGQQVSKIIVRESRLRWPVPERLSEQLSDARLMRIERRAKYLLLQFTPGTLLLHLGMSGSLRIVPDSLAANKHDHIDLVFTNALTLRLTDPRRFGAVLWLGISPHQHALLNKLGLEPLTDEFCAEYLYAKSRYRKVAVKQFIMDQQVVTGIGNIYANEALFASGIRPTVRAGRISRKRYATLTHAIKEVLTAAIAVGGTTLRDFVGSDGQPGYFKQQLNVYGRTGLPCKRCKQPLQEQRMGGRSTVYCRSCQH